jgi:RNA-directed DNA polymerase
MVDGERHHAEALLEEVASVLAPSGLRVSAEKTKVCHLDEGSGFIGFRIQRRTKAGANRKHACTYPPEKALASIIGKGGMLTNSGQNESLADLLRRLNPVLRGWCNYFRHAAASATFRYLNHYVWHRVAQWLLNRHKG